MTVSPTGREPRLSFCVSGHFSTAEPQQACQDRVKCFRQYFLFVAEEIRSAGKQNTVVFG